MQINALNTQSFKGSGGNETIIDLGPDDYKIIAENDNYELIPATYTTYTDDFQRNNQETEEEDWTDKFRKADVLYQKLVPSDDIKGPCATILAVGYAVIKAFVKGAGAGFFADKMLEGKPSEFLTTMLKKGSKMADSASKTLTNASPKYLKAITNKTGKLIGSANQSLVQMYKNITKNSKTRGLAIIGGLVTVASLVPGILKKDNNEDGVPDIAQRSMNVYEENSKKINGIMEKAGILQELARIFA